VGKKSKKKKKASNKKHNEQLVNKKVKRPKISLCMIVKNEERYLDNCLKSVKDVVDEIVIVDTGSEDRTVEIAKNYTDKVYFHPWKNSFSEARNHYLKYAAGDWIFQIDADEELVREDVSALLDAVKNEELDAIMVQIISQFKKGRSEAIHSVERIFRNNGVIHYEGRVHNRVVGITNAKVYPIRLIHYGYDLNQKESKKKCERTISLLKMDLKDDPNNPITYHYLSCSYIGQGMLHQSLEASLTAIRLAEAKNDKNMIYLWSRYNAAMAYYRLKELKKAEEMALSALKKYPKHIDAHFILILVYYDQKQWSRLMDHGNEYIRLIQLLRKSPMAFNNLVTCSLNEEWNIHVLIGIAYFELGQAERSEEAFEMAVSCAPEPFMALRAAGIYFHKKKQLARAWPYLERAHQANPEDVTINDLLRQKTLAEGRGYSNETISCCMIVKNEEAFLEQCLESVKDHVDEIIIVDTGSTDGTVEIARRYTDKVYFHAWEDSFSKARNQALQYAANDWIFQIDADEELVEGGGAEPREAVRDAGEADVIYVNIISTYSGGTRKARHNFERLFRNNGLIHYEGIVHNRVVGGKKAKYSQIELRHYGYDVEEKKAHEKFIRTADLLKKQIEGTPDNPMPHHYLGASYLARGMNEEAVKESVLAVDLAEQQKDGHPIYLWSHFNAAMAFFRMGDLEQARSCSLKAVDKFADHPDSYYMLTMIAAEKGEWKDVLTFGHNYLKLVRHYEENPDKAGLMINNMMNEEPSIYLLMGHAFHAKKDYNRMTECYEKACEISESGKKWQAWWNIATFHLDKSEDLERARRYLDQALEESPDEPDIWYMLAKLNNKSGLFKPERRCLERLFDLGSEDIVVLNRLAALCIEAGDLDQALEALERARKSGTLNYPALCNLGLIYKNQKQMENAIKAYMQAVELHPHGVEAWTSLGEISLNVDRLDEAGVFFERALSLQSGLVKVLLQLCEVELRQNRMIEFLRWCDLVLKELGLDRDKTINDMEDVVAILLEIDFAARNSPEIAAQALRVLRLLPVDFGSFPHTKTGALLKDKDAEETEFFLKELQKLSEAPLCQPSKKS
jgi:glycosyltransferase involved in cell wall biosynthesis/thioredoxin-like negative regulator of GroEL